MIFLKIGEKELPFAFGMAGVRRFEETTKRPIGSVLVTFSEGDMSKIMFSDLLLLLSCGLETGARKAKDPKPYSLETVEDLLDDSGDTWPIITAALNEVSASLFSPAQEEAPGDNAKKKATTIPTSQPG